MAIGSDSMGGGSEELGKTLMKNFIYSLTELDAVPKHLLFFNAGVTFTVEGATTLDDLKTLHDKGTNISSCGACLNYFCLIDKIKIGDIANMFNIVNIMEKAKKLINM